MHTYSLSCTRCGAVYRDHPRYLCDSCGGSLDVKYDYREIFGRIGFPEMWARAEPGIWKYRELLPVPPGTEPVTLGEGNTPLLEARRLLAQEGGQRLLLKMESSNPTLAFKDRALAVALTAARTMGLTEAVCASTGNTGVAAAAYAARAGLPCTIYVPENTPPEKLSAMTAYGARLRCVQGHFGDAYRAAGEEAKLRGAFNLTSTYLNPYAIEGNKTLAYEIMASLGEPPDWIAVPIGAGPLLWACYKGFRELQLAGYTTKLPRMIGVQAAGCAPIVRAYERGELEVSPWEGGFYTAASGIADPLTTYPADGTRTLSAIRVSGGSAVAVEDRELLAFRRLLAEREGVLAEISSVASVAALAALYREGRISGQETAVAVVTGHGLKDMTEAIKFSEMGVK
ncbi:Threonine synthase [compost metagenome]